MNWDEFEKARPQPQRGEKQRRFDELCAAVFSAGSGPELLRLMRALTIDARAPTGASEAVLREREAVRNFVFEIERARERGLAETAKPKTPA